VIAQATQTTEPDVFILRQRLAELNRAAPHPFENGFVGEQRRTFDVVAAKRRDHVRFFSGGSDEIFALRSVELIVT
jgi:hypothetical protein